MKKQLIIWILAAGLFQTWRALAGVTETVDLGVGSQYTNWSTGVNDTTWDGGTTFHNELYYDPYSGSFEDTWHDVLIHMQGIETSPATTFSGSAYSTYAWTDRYRALDYAVHGGSMVGYNRFINYTMVNLAATNGFVAASLEWNVTLDDGSHFNSTSVSPSGPTLLKMVVWPDYYPQGDNFPRGRSWQVTTPNLKATRQVADAQPRTNSDALAQQGDPIDSINGNVSIKETDIAVLTAGIPLEFRRWYSTTLDGDGSLGPRWSHTYLWRIWETNTVFSGATNRWLVLRTGGDWHWAALSVTNSGHEIVDADWRWNWSKTNNAYTVTRPGGFAYRFNTNGFLIRIDNVFSNALSLTYTNLSSVQRLARVEHSDGRALQFSYDSSNRLSQVAASFTNLSVRFNYTSSGLPTNVVRTADTVVESTRYDWDSSSQVITQRLDNAGVPRVWEYSGAMGTRSYVGTGRWYEVSMDYSTKAENRTQVVTYRGDTNMAFYQEYDPVRNKITATSDSMPMSVMRIAIPANAVITNVVWYYTGDSWSVFANNPCFQSEVFSLCKSTPVPQLGWSGTRYTRDDYGRIVAAETRDGTPGVTAWSKQSLAYDPQGRLTNSAYGYSVEPTNLSTISWNTNWETVAAITDPEGHRTEWDYTNGVVSKERVFPATNQPAETIYAYTTNGLLATVTNANGHWVRYQYNGYGYPTSTIPQVGPTNCMIWDSLGHLKEIDLPGSGTTTNDQPQTVPRAIVFDPDELGRVRQITWPDASCETFAFDAIGNITNHVDTAGRTTSYAWLPTRKLASITRGIGSEQGTVSFIYDQQFNALKITDERTRPVETYKLDLQDRPITVTNIEGQTMTIAWGLTDFMQSIVRFDGSTVSFDRDSGGRLSAVTYPDAVNRFSYLRNGLMVTASNQWGMISNAYDGANRLISQSSPVPNGNVSYALYPAGQVSNVVSIAGTNTYALDAAERLTTLTASRKGLAATSFQYGYNPLNGAVSTILCSNGVSCSETYDKMDRLSTLIWKNASNQVLRSRSYTYNSAGMISQVGYETGEQVIFTYDSLDRVTGEQHVNAAGQTTSLETYGFDLAGNRTNKTVWSGVTPLMTVNYALGTGNRLASWSVAQTDLVGQVDVAGTSSEAIGTNDRFGWLYVSNLNGRASVKPYVSGTNFWAYELTVGLGTQKIVAAIRDVAGNTTRVTNQVCLTVVTNGAYQYSDAGCVTNIMYRGKDYNSTVGLTWNGQYQLTAVSTNGTVAERHGYDALGRRLWTWDATAGTNWMVYDGPHVIAEVDASGSLKKSYVYGPGIDNVLSMAVYGTATNTYYYLKDHLGSVIALTDKDGNVVESYRYDACGRTTAYDAMGNDLAQSAYGNCYCWQGREYSWKTGLYYFRARWYSAVEGRWLSNDPIGISGGLNQYAFCGNNPVNFRDPFGLCKAGGYPDIPHEIDDGPIRDGTFDFLALTPVKIPFVGAVMGKLFGSVAEEATVMTVDKFVLTGLTKAEARVAAQGMGLPAAQAAAVNSSIGRATATSVTKVTQNGPDVIVEIFRSGENGYQVVESTVRLDGSKAVVQKAYDAAGRLVHFDPK